MATVDVTFSIRSTNIINNVFTLNFKYICKAYFIITRNFYNETMNKILLKFYPRLPLNERTTIII